MPFFLFLLVSIAIGGSGFASGGFVVIFGSCWAGGIDNGSGYAEVVAAAAAGLVTGGSVGSSGLILLSVIGVKYIRSSMPRSWVNTYLVLILNAMFLFDCQ